MGQPLTYASKREIEFGTEYAGISVTARQRENWQNLNSWNMVDRKQTLGLNVNRTFAKSRKVDLNASFNRFNDATGKKTTYHSGLLNLDIPQIARVVDLNANMRLSRLGSFQTNKTYLKVESGKGDYVLIDSVYLPQSNGDYILVTEQVGTLTPSVEAEKRVQINADLSKLAKSFLIAGTSLRYETSLHEIGNDMTSFQTRWLLPSLAYFGAVQRFRQRSDEYRYRRYDRAIGLRSEFSYRIRSEDNLIDVLHPQANGNELFKLLFNQRLGERDFVEISGEAENLSDQQFGRYNLTVHRRSLITAGSHFRGLWEMGATVEIGRENSDSMSLRATTLRITPKVNYNLVGRGRIETTVFMLQVIEAANRPILLQMADGFPTGANFGGTILIDFSFAENFSFRLTGQGDIRHGEPGRYFLRTELISRFQ